MNIIDQPLFPWPPATPVIPDYSWVLGKALEPQSTSQLVAQLKARRDHIKRELESHSMLLKELEYLEYLLEKEEQFHK